MIKSSDDNEANAADRSDKRPGKCWHSEEGTQTVRIITEDKRKFTFPYFHFVRGLLEETEDGKQLLTLKFSSDIVEIRSRRLDPLDNALDDLSLAWVRVLPSRHAPLARTDSGIVTEIVVRSLEERQEDGGET